MSNVVTAVFTTGTRTRTAAVWQYDTGMKLQIEGLELPEEYEVHFANSLTGESTTVDADSTGIWIGQNQRLNFIITLEI